MDLRSKISGIQLTGKNVLAAAFLVSLLAGTAYSAGSNTYGIDINQGSLRMHGNSINNAVLGTSLAAGGNKITNLADPTNAQDAATMSWVNNNDDYEADTNTDASTECSGSNYLAGDGTCNSDSYEADTDTTVDECDNCLHIGTASGDEVDPGADQIGQGDRNMDVASVDLISDTDADVTSSTNSADLEIYANSYTDGAIDLNSNDQVVIETDDDSTTTGCTFTNAGDLNCDGTKSWVHSLNSTHEAVYASQEGPQVRAVVEGTVQVENGKATVDLPSHFSKTVSDSKPSLKAQATPRSLATVAVTSRSDSQITIEATKDVKVDYRVTGIREGYEDRQVVQKKGD